MVGKVRKNFSVPFLHLVLLYSFIIPENIGATMCNPFSNSQTNSLSREPISDLDSTEYAFGNYDLDPLYAHITPLLPGRVGRIQEIIQLMGLYLPYKWSSVKEIYAYKTLLSYAMEENHLKSRIQSEKIRLQTLYKAGKLTVSFQSKCVSHI